MSEKVMCQYCKNYELMTCNNQHFCNRFGGYVTEEDFCSRGEPITNKVKDTRTPQNDEVRE